MPNFATRKSVLALTFSALLFPSFARTQAPAAATWKLVPVTLSGPAAAQSSRLSAEPGRKQVEGHIPPWARDARDAGAMGDSEKMQLILTVARAPQVEAAFQQLLKDLQDPLSPRFHQWLTPQQIGEQFGPTDGDLRALTTWLASQGFTITDVTPSRTFVQVSAAASVVESALGTRIRNYATAQGTLYAPSSEPSLPAYLAPIVSAINGLSSVPYRTHSTHVQPGPVVSGGTAAGSLLRPDYTYTSASGASSHYLLPGDFNTIYDVKAAQTAGITGAGYRVTILGGSDLTAADITNYESLAGLASYTPTTVVGSGFTDPGVSASDQTEGMLDFERVYGTAPGAPIDFVIAKNWLTGSINQSLVLYAINTVNDPVMSLSFGACEAAQAPAYIGTENSMYAQAAAQGISVLVSSGDAGAAGCMGISTTYANTASINDICATGNVTCVGGTEFADFASPASFWSTTNGAGGLSALGYIPEGAWNESSFLNSSGQIAYEAAGTGGGVSTIIAKPSFQVGTGVPADGFRDVPDISFSSSGHDGYLLCQAAVGYPCGSGGNIGVVGGTSAAAPSMAGIAAMIDQKLGTRQGNLNTMLYRLALSTPGAFHDATPASSGVGASCTTATPSMCNNSVPEQTTSLLPIVVGYPLTVGYDQATGLGSLDVNAFLAAASALSVSSSSISRTPASASLTTTAGTTTSTSIAITSVLATADSLICTVSSTTSTSLPTCTLSANFVPASTSSISTTSLLTLTSVAPHDRSGNFSGNRGLTLTGLGGGTFAAMLLLFLPRRGRKALRAARVLCLMAFFAAGLTAVSGCGGGGTPATTTTITTTGGTTKGTYTVTVAASGAAAGSTTVSVTIQ